MAVGYLVTTIVVTIRSKDEFVNNYVPQKPGGRYGEDVGPRLKILLRRFTRQVD